MEFPEGRCASPRARDPYVSNAKRSDGCALDFAAGVSIRADWKSAMSDQEAATSVIGDSLMCLCRLHIARRSEEHTSELQSLMRISYAVFCLKKKTNITHIICQTPHRKQ